LVQGSSNLPQHFTWKAVDKTGNPLAYNLPLKMELTVVDIAGNKTTSEPYPFWLDFLHLTKERKLFVFDLQVVHYRQKVDLTKQGEQIWRKAIAILKEIPDLKELTIKVHTFTEGREKQNLELAQKRGQELQQALATRLPNITINLEAIGEERPYLEDKSSKWDARYEINY
jgi:outer membrane protein OmpA-like peptidoglycan-associated protein